MTTAKEFIAAAVAEVGTKESPVGSNCNPYSHELGRPCEFWCADFVVCMARRVGLHLPSESAYTPSLAQAFKDHHQWYPDPQPGDLAFWDFPDAEHRIQHVSIVVSPHGVASIIDVSGNTSSGATGSQHNGDGVYRRTRGRTYCVGFGRPQFTDAPPAPAPSGWDDMIFAWRDKRDNAVWLTEQGKRRHIQTAELHAYQAAGVIDTVPALEAADADVLLMTYPPK